MTNRHLQEQSNQPIMYVYSMICKPGNSFAKVLNFQFCINYFLSRCHPLTIQARTSQRRLEIIPTNLSCTKKSWQRTPSVVWYLFSCMYMKSLVILRLLLSTSHNSTERTREQRKWGTSSSALGSSRMTTKIKSLITAALIWLTSAMFWQQPSYWATSAPNSLTFR